MFDRDDKPPDMTEGDIARLNRMYKCPQQSESVKSETRNEGGFGETRQNPPEEGQTRSDIAKVLGFAIDALMSIIKPLCALAEAL